VKSALTIKAYFESINTFPTITLASISFSAANMGVEKQVLKQGNGVIFPKKHDEVAMEYTGSTALSIPVA
jgi:hypothetical protein